MHHKNYINGEWLTGAGEIHNLNPSDTNDHIGTYTQATPAQADAAAAGAAAAQPAWRAAGLEHRAAALHAIGTELMTRAADIGRELSREEGKPLAEGKGEVYRAGQFFTYYAAEALREQGLTADSVRPHIEIEARREPVGAVAVITPWNFPIATAAWKIAPALAFGNAVIWKPSSLTPATAHTLAKLIAAQKLPAGAFQLVMGGGDIGEAIAAHPAVSAVTFTGSCATGRRVAQAAASHFAKCQLEMGSKNALLIMDDADLDAAVAAAAAGAYSGTGQKCTASSRLLVHRAVCDAFTDKLKTTIAALKIGNALDPATTMGPLAGEAQLKNAQQWITRIRQSAAAIAYGGDHPATPQPGYYMSPTLVTDSTNDMDFNRAEMFAPIAAIQRIDDYDQGLAIANDTEYGLVAGIFTRGLARAAHFRRHVQTGCVTVNLPTAGTDYHVPFGGAKNSSMGAREQGTVAVEFFTQLKTAYIGAGQP